MASSILTYKDRVICVGDYYLEIIIYYFISNAKETLINSNIQERDLIIWVEEYTERLSSFLEGIFAGGIGFQLDEISKHKYKLSFFIMILLQIKRKLKAKGKFIPIEELNYIEDFKVYDEKYYSNEPLEIDVITNLIDEILSMISVDNSIIN